MKNQRACAGARRAGDQRRHPLTAPDPLHGRVQAEEAELALPCLFTVRWNAIWIMPKHVFEKVDDPVKFDFNKPVSLGAYMLHSYDPERQMVHLAAAR